ncbi:hypothetical protein FRC01_006979 [Tulasnella sp. 417]|nr:hypothetical protein FRC01_006979 [Tulasnella sp. 417]
MVTGHPPYPDVGGADEIISLLSADEENRRTPEPDSFPACVPGDLVKLLQRCWDFDPWGRSDVWQCTDAIKSIPGPESDCGQNDRKNRRLRDEVVDSLGDSLIARERLKPGPNPTLRKVLNTMTMKAELLPSGALVVVKEIDLREILRYSSRLDFVKQTALLSSLKHENILEFTGYSATDYFNTVSLIAPHMVNGNLADYMQKEIDMNGKIELARCSMNGLQYLHSREPPIVHGKITPSNVLIDGTGKAVLSDVGLAAIEFYSIAITPRDSVRWCSPEVNLGDSAVVQSDIWSWACVVLQLLTRDLPYSFIQHEGQIKSLMSARRQGRLTPEAFHELDDIPDVLVQLLQRCWNFDFMQRPKSEECMHKLNYMLGADVEAHSGAQDQPPPPDDDISYFITSVSAEPICVNGRFGDVFKGVHRTEGEVALKRLRIGGPGTDEQIIRRFEREADTWRQLEHPHVLKFLGTYRPGAHLYFVSPFAKNGTVLDYVRNRPGINRVRLLCETSDAIDYLHRENIVHGDIKASNLLISDEGQVMLCDFGLAKSTYSQTSVTLKGAGTLRWQSPELWDGGPRTLASDV